MDATCAAPDADRMAGTAAAGASPAPVDAARQALTVESAATAADADHQAEDELSAPTDERLPAELHQAAALDAPEPAVAQADESRDAAEPVAPPALLRSAGL